MLCRARHRTRRSPRNARGCEHCGAFGGLTVGASLCVGVILVAFVFFSLGPKVGHRHHVRHPNPSRSGCVRIRAPTAPPRAPGPLWGAGCTLHAAGSPGTALYRRRRAFALVLLRQLIYRNHTCPQP